MKCYISFFILLSLFSCREKQPETVLVQNTGEVFGTTYNIQYGSEEDLHDEIKRVFERLDKSLSTYRPDSDISRVNEGDTIKADSMFREVLEVSRRVWKETGGIFDPTVGTLVNAYGFGPGEQLEEVAPEKIDSMLAFTGLDKINLTPEGYIEKADPRVYLDFNAIAKGYALDLVGRVFDQKGIENYLVEIGGELLAKGRNPDKDQDWRVAIDDPMQDEDERAFVKVIALKDGAMATSGNYRKHRTDPETGQKYVHIIHPLTGQAEKSDVLSASVFANTCTEADAYATALMVMGLEDGKAFLENHPELDAYLIYSDNDGQTMEYMTDGFAEWVISDQ